MSTTSTVTRESVEVTTNPAQRLYLIHIEDGLSCLGFDYVRDNANYIAEALDRDDLRVFQQDVGTMAAYGRYIEAIEAWASSPKSVSFFWGPGVDAKLQRAIIRAYQNGTRVRVICGDTSTGLPWSEIEDTVGTIGRSSGKLRVPLLIPNGGFGGPGILCRNVLRILSMQTGKVLYEHDKWKSPPLFMRGALKGFEIVDVDRGLILGALPMPKAAAALAFFLGEAIEPHVFNP